jgi:hypothetical protein
MREREREIERGREGGREREAVNVDNRNTGRCRSRYQIKSFVQFLFIDIEVMMVNISLYDDAALIGNLLPTFRRSLWLLLSGH